jgi:hypothetical protein
MGQALAIDATLPISFEVFRRVVSIALAEAFQEGS